MGFPALGIDVFWSGNLDFDLNPRDMSNSASTFSYRLSGTQTRKLLGDALSESDGGHNIEQVVCNTTETINLPVFQQSWQTMIERHSALRVGFKRDEGQQPFQEIRSPIQLPVAVEDHSHVGALEAEAFVEDWLERDRKQVFDLSSPPLMRITVFRFANNSVTWVWTFHHILMDGRSFLLVLEDFFACYDATFAGLPVVLPKRKHFSEFVSWYHNWLASQQKSAGAYWQKMFSEDEADSVLSISRASATADPHPKKIRMEIDADQTEKLQRLVEENGVAINAVVQGAWALLLSRYYRSKSVTFTTIRSCRRGSIEGTEGMIGMLMNFVPAHVRIPDRASVIDFLKGIREEQLAVRSYQWTPWEAIRNVIPVAASKQLFDSCVFYERYNEGDEMTRRFGKGGTRTFSLRAKSNVPLLLVVVERPHLSFELSYRANTFEKEDVQQLSRSFLALFDQILAMPNEPVSSLELLNSSDKAAVMQKLSGPELNVPEDKGLHHWFEDQVKRSPHELAVVAECRLTYEQLDRRATQLAERLLALGTGTDQLVVIYLPRSAMSLVAILGILKSGAAYLPIDVTMPKARVSGLLEDANACAVISEKSFADTLPVLSIPVLLLDATSEDIQPSSHPAMPKIRGSALAYVIPTSGTTGRPKLTGVEHRQASNLLGHATQHLLQPEDVRWVPFIDSPSFDSSISQIFVTLALGGTLVLVEDIIYIRNSAYYEKFTCLGTTPSLLSFILEQLGLPPAVRLIGLGAEAIPAALLEKLDGLPQVRKVINYYGPTEATVYCSVAIAMDRSEPGNSVDLRARGRVIGRPIANTRIYLVDDFGRLVPPGAPGEIYIAGAAVARGYLNHSGTASENFLPDCFVAKPGERMYRSGDIGCLKADGQLEIHGRKDHQLKFNGVRIEAAEIENAMLSFPGVRQAVVDLRSDGEGRKRLVGYMAADGENFSKQKLRKVLRLLLPGAMIPQHFVVANSLPLTSNGKVDREALSRFELGIETSTSSDHPATPGEIQMKKLWEENLSRSLVGFDQDYFEMGGDSLSAVNLLLAVEKQFEIRLKPQVLLESSTISELVREIETSLARAESAQDVAPASLLPLQESGNRTPLILIPGGSGEGFLSYKNFAQAFLPNHPVHVVHSPHAKIFEESVDPAASLATHFAREIVSLVKDRPFVLFGHCVGGLLAWHVGCALKEEQSPPFKLVLYDAPVPRKAVNVTSMTGEAPRSRFRRWTMAYRLAWANWLTRHEDNWRTRVRFLFWALKNFFMRRGLDRSKAGRDNFAKLAYLRTLQSCPLSNYSGDTVLIYHHGQEEVVSTTLWHDRCMGEIKFEFIPGNHDDWENCIFHTVPLVRHELEACDARNPAGSEDEVVQAAAATFLATENLCPQSAVPATGDRHGVA